MEITCEKARAKVAKGFFLGALMSSAAASERVVRADDLGAGASKPVRAGRKKGVATPLVARLETLDARASREKYAGGEPVYLDVSLVNKSAKAAEFLMLGPNVEFKVKREGKVVGLTRKGREDSQGVKISYRSVPVGGKFGYRVLLSRLFDLSRAGNYVVSCTKYLKNENRDPGADLVGPRLVSPDVKFSVSDLDIEIQTEKR